MLAEKHFAAKSVWLDQRDYRVLKKIAKKTRVSVAHFIREGLRMVIAKYAAFAEDDPELNLELYIAAPAHAELLQQRRSMKDTIQPHEGLVNPVVAEAGSWPPFVQHAVDDIAEMAENIERELVDTEPPKLDASRVDAAMRLAYPDDGAHTLVGADTEPPPTNPSPPTRHVDS